MEQKGIIDLLPSLGILHRFYVWYELCTFLSDHTRAKEKISLPFLFVCSQYYTRFKSYCCEAYNILRKSSNLILNLFHLMAGSNIPDIASDPEKGILKVISLPITILYFFQYYHCLHSRCNDLVLYFCWWF